MIKLQEKGKKISKYTIWINNIITIVVIQQPGFNFVLKYCKSILFVRGGGNKFLSAPHGRACYIIQYILLYLMYIIINYEYETIYYMYYYYNYTYYYLIRNSINYYEQP